jgi:hypothetical protein
VENKKTTRLELPCDDLSFTQMATQYQDLLSTIERCKFLDMLNEQVRQGGIVPPADLDPLALRNELLSHMHDQISMLTCGQSLVDWNAEFASPDDPILN